MNSQPTRYEVPSQRRRRAQTRPLGEQAQRILGRRRHDPESTHAVAIPSQSTRPRGAHRVGRTPTETTIPMTLAEWAQKSSGGGPIRMVRPASPDLVATEETEAIEPEGKSRSLARDIVWISVTMIVTSAVVAMVLTELL